jgi:hypothetical protein
VNQGDCVNIDECDLDPELCGQNQVCIDNDGGFACQCADGFFDFDANGICQNVDECTLPDACTALGGGECVDTEGSFACRPAITSVTLQGTPLSSATFLTGGNTEVVLQVNQGQGVVVPEDAVFYGSDEFPTDFACANSVSPTVSNNVKTFTCSLAPGAGDLLRLAVVYTFNDGTAGLSDTPSAFATSSQL